MGKFVVLLVLLVAGLQAEFPNPEFLELLKPIIAKCEESTGVDKSLVEQFSKGTMVEDAKFKCYLKCMFLEAGVLDEATGHFRYEKMLSLLPQDMKSIAYDMGKNCIHFKGEESSDLCQLSYDLHQCWQKSDPEHYFLMRR